MYIKIGPVSFNTKTRKVNFDRRTLKRRDSKVKHAVYIVGGILATAAIRAAVSEMSR